MRRFILVLPVVISIVGCSDDCTNTIIRRVDAPDGRHSAAIFQRDCGATTGFSTQITVSEPGDLPAGPGNVFRADDRHGVARVGSWGGPWAELRWVTNDRLLVRHAEKSRIFEQRTEVTGVRIDYESVPKAVRAE